MHKKWQVLINVYVDDFKVAGKGPLNHVWKALRDAGLDIDDPVKYQTYLGCAQREIQINRDVLQRQINTYKTMFTHSDAPEANATVFDCDVSAAPVTMQVPTTCGWSPNHESATNLSAQENDQLDQLQKEICFTNDDISKETPWVKNNVKQFDDDSSAALRGAANDGQSRVATAQGTVKLGMTFDMPSDLSNIRAYENEMFGFVQQCIDQWCQLT